MVKLEFEGKCLPFSDDGKSANDGKRAYNPFKDVAGRCWHFVFWLDLFHGFLIEINRGKRVFYLQYNYLSVLSPNSISPTNIWRLTLNWQWAGKKRSKHMQIKFISSKPFGWRKLHERLLTWYFSWCSARVHHQWWFITLFIYSCNGDFQNVKLQNIWFWVVCR